jgi:hypothetical protein
MAQVKEDLGIGYLPCFFSFLPRLTQFLAILRYSSFGHVDAILPRTQKITVKIAWVHLRNAEVIERFHQGDHATVVDPEKILCPFAPCAFMRWRFGQNWRWACAISLPNVRLSGLGVGLGVDHALRSIRPDLGNSRPGLGVGKRVSQMRHGRKASRFPAGDDKFGCVAGDFDRDATSAAGKLGDQPFLGFAVQLGLDKASDEVGCDDVFGVHSAYFASGYFSSSDSHRRWLQ